MPNKPFKAPQPADLLFKNLFDGCTADQSFEHIAAGLSACRQNAARLLSDVEVLVTSGRLSSARFLLTTAREEIAKLYILVDMCRLDLEKHPGVLRLLCRAFYNHVLKHAYLEVQQSPNLTSMYNVKEIWESETQRWWPASPESGEPDMPHETVFDREFPLYVDFDDYAGEWWIPADSGETAYFMKMFGETPVSRTQKLIDLWHKADGVGLCSPQVLAIVNAVFRKHYMREDASLEQLIRLYDQAGDVVLADTGIRKELFMDSPLAEWPLYRLV